MRTILLPTEISDLEKAKILIAGYHVAFPDSRGEILHIVAEGDLVIVHPVYTGTNTGPFIGATHDTMDSKHMEWMSKQFPNGRYLLCPNGSHCAMFDDQQTYFQVPLGG